MFKTYSTHTLKPAVLEEFKFKMYLTFRVIRTIRAQFSAFKKCSNAEDY